MLKAAAWRLAHLLSVRPAEVMSADETKLDDLIRRVEAPPKPVKGAAAPARVTSLGPIIRLAEKVRRLKGKA